MLVALVPRPSARRKVVSVRGGVTFFRSGGGAAARAYLEADHARADDYYLAEGTGLADRIVYARDEAGATLSASRDVLTGDAYEAWDDWKDPVSGQVRGVPRERRTFDPYTGEGVVTATSPRFAEMTVNADKSLSIAAALNPEISTALDAAMRDAAEAMTAYLAALDPRPTIVMISHRAESMAHCDQVITIDRGTMVP